MYESTHALQLQTTNGLRLQKEKSELLRLAMVAEISKIFFLFPLFL